MGLSCKEVERLLLAGKPLQWADPDTHKTSTIELLDPRQQHLFQYLLECPVQTEKRLQPPFLDGLRAAFMNTAGTESVEQPSSSQCKFTWLLKRIEIYGFGGINCYNSKAPLTYDLDGDSTCFEGPNGSGKSSLLAAIAWCLTGNRISDSVGPIGNLGVPAKVSFPDGSAFRTWPPLATYPTTPEGFDSPPKLGVRLTFVDNNTGEEASATRKLTSKGPEVNIDPRIEKYPHLIEVGILMPSRLRHLRLGEKAGKLSEAVQALTGLEELSLLGDLVAELCHGSREFLGYAKRMNRASLQTSYSEAVSRAERIAPLGVIDFDPLRLLREEGVLNRLQGVRDQLHVNISETLAIIGEDLGTGVDIGDPSQQKDVLVAVERAKEDIQNGLDGLDAVRLLNRLIDPETSPQLTALRTQIDQTEDKLREALDWHTRQLEDNRLRLKVLAARWHAQYQPPSEEISECPLCGQSLRDRNDVAEELSELRIATDLAEHTLAQACNAMGHELRSTVPSFVAELEGQIILPTKAGIVDSLRNTFVVPERYSKILVSVARRVEDFVQDNELQDSPLAPPVGQSQYTDIVPLERILSNAKRIISLGQWWATERASYHAAWSVLVGAQDREQPSPKHGLFAYLKNLDDACVRAKPFAEAAREIDSAVTAAERWAVIEAEQTMREAICDRLAPLKLLRGYVECETKSKIKRLSNRISRILDQIYLSDRLRYAGTTIAKQSITIRATPGQGYLIDAELIANTSWLRAVLWAFIFALREETLEGIGFNPFPLLLLDDPQSTFDITHRRKWAEHIVALTGLRPDELNRAQCLIATYDGSFVDHLLTEGFAGRTAQLEAANVATGAMTIIDGREIDKLWAKASASEQSADAQAYIARVRIEVETLLRLMLREEGPCISALTWGKLRDRLQSLCSKQAAPYHKPLFRRLVDLLLSSHKEVKLLNGPHHSASPDIGFAQAIEVNRYWAKELRPVLHDAFNALRDFRLLNGERRSHFARPADAPFPDCSSVAVRALELPLQGQAAAVTNGRVSDGLLEVTTLPEDERSSIILQNHGAFRLVAPTLEPVVNVGDIVLVKNYGETNLKNLCVAVAGERVYARRFDVVEANPDLAVLTAQAVNPYDIRPPLVLHVSTFQKRKIVGVLYNSNSAPQHAGSEDEVLAVDGEAPLLSLAKKILGLFKIEGRSAEPYALDGQYLVVLKPSSDPSRLSVLDGQIVIAVDENNAFYFKRLRFIDTNTVVLESLDISGKEGPVVLGTQPGERTAIRDILPVAGVLFELP